MNRFGRRGFLSGAIALLAARIAVGAERGKIHRVAFLSPVERGPRDAAFLEGLREFGYVEGRNLDLQMRFADGRPERLSVLVEELIRLKPEVLVVGSTIGGRAAKQATQSIPIVFAASSDPVAGGLVSNLARPGGNVTGFSLAYGDGFVGKWLEILKEAVPQLSQAAAIWSSANAAAAGYLEEIRAAARSLNVALHAHHAAKPAELDEALRAIAADAVQGLVIMPSPFAASRRKQLVEFAATRKLPAVYFADSFVRAGGLMSYGPSIADTYRRAAAHVDKILKGARPGDLPVERPTRFELVLNLETARTLGITIPRSLRLRADWLIGG